MKTVEFKNGALIEVPETFAEMTGAQLRYTMRLYDALETGRLTIADFRVRMLFRLINYKPRRQYITMCKRRPDLIDCIHENIALMIDRLLPAFFDGSEKEGYRIRFDALENPIPTISWGWMKRYGPAIALSDITFSQFRYATTKLSLYLKNPDPRTLDEMIAALWLPKGARFSTDRIRTRLIRRVHRWKKTTILLWICACVNYIQSGDIIIDGETINLSPIFSGGERSGGASIGWTGVLFDLAEKHIFGDVRHTDDAALYDVLTLLYHNYLKIKEYETRTK